MSKYVLKPEFELVAEKRKYSYPRLLAKWLDFSYVRKDQIWQAAH